MFLIHIQLSKQGKRFAQVAYVVIKGPINFPVSIFISVVKKKKKKKRVSLALQTHVGSDYFDSFQAQTASCCLLSAEDTNCTLIGPEALEVKRKKSVKCYNLSGAQDLMPNRQMVRII